MGVFPPNFDQKVIFIFDVIIGSVPAQVYRPDRVVISAIGQFSFLGENHGLYIDI